MTEVVLWVGVYGQSTSFSVHIPSNATVDDLKTAIVNMKKDVNELFRVDPATVNLYFAREKNEDGTWSDKWLKSDEALEDWLKRGRKNYHPYVKMLPSWNLDLDYLGENFDLGWHSIHILVELPQDNRKRKRQNDVDELPASNTTRTIVHSWGGRLHKFPSVGLSTAWRLWWHGNIIQNLIPFSLILSCDLNGRKLQNALCEWKFLMSKLASLYNQKSGKTITINASELEVATSFEIAVSELQLLLNAQNKKSARFEQLKVSTVVTMVRRLNPTLHPRPFKRRKTTSSSSNS